MKFSMPLLDPEKLSIAAGLGLACVLLFAGIGLLLYDNRLYREQTLKEITLQTRTLAANQAPSLDFDDLDGTQEYLDALQLNPQIDQAAVYNRAGNLVARYARPDSPDVPQSAPAQGYVIDGDSISVVAPVVRNDRSIGSVYIKAATEPLTRRLPRYGAILLLFTMASLVVGILAIARTRLTAANAKLLIEMQERNKAEEALRQSQKMEAVGQLTGGIAHDFNNMLAIIMGSLSMLQRQMAKGKTDVSRYAESAMEGARRAATLTQQLLAFSRRQPLAPVPLNVTNLIFGLSDLMGRTLGEQINLEVINSPGTWQIFADQAQLETAILNLAVNARDAMPDGGKLIIKGANVHLEAMEVGGIEPVPAGDYVVITVTDTGSGMPPDVVAKAFEPFFTTKSVGKGTGLGLSQVYGFVKQSRGHVMIKSEVDKGTTVALYLPRLMATNIQATREHAPQPPRDGKSDEIVLVVEDDAKVRDITVTSLRELGYTVRHADGVGSALQTLETQPNVTLLFTDIVMPDGNGRALANEVKRRWPELKILFTTGYTRDAIVHDGVVDSDVQVLMKPFTFEQLASKVREVLEAQ